MHSIGRSLWRLTGPTAYDSLNTASGYPACPLPTSTCPRSCSRTRWHVSLAALLCVVATGRVGVCQESSAVALPSGVKAVWDLSKAYRETTPTRERICINGLWRWQPAEGQEPTSRRPATGAISRCPGCWPGISDYMQKDSQTVYPHPSWKGEEFGGVTTAWYQREIDVPGDWTGRRITRHRGVPEFPRRGVRGRQEGGRDVLPVGRSGPYRGMSAGQQARAEH